MIDESAVALTIIQSQQSSSRYIEGLHSKRSDVFFIDCYFCPLQKFGDNQDF